MSFRFYESQLAFLCYINGLGELPLTYSQTLQCYESGVTLDSALDICRAVATGITFSECFNVVEKQEC